MRNSLDKSNARQIGRQELQALNSAVMQAQQGSALPMQAIKTKHTVTSAQQTATIHSAIDDAVSFVHEPVFNHQEQDMGATPWTTNNAALPAYPAEYTPQLPYIRHAEHNSGVTHEIGIQGSIHANENDEPADRLMHGPSQAGPLAMYPGFAAVDPQHRWQRISNWAAHDSHVAAVPLPHQNTSHAHLWGVASTAQEVLSISTSMMELEQQRARRSAPTSPVQDRALPIRSTQQAMPHFASNLPPKAKQPQIKPGYDLPTAYHMPSAERAVANGSDKAGNTAKAAPALHASVDQLLLLLDNTLTAPTTVNGQAAVLQKMPAGATDAKHAAPLPPAVPHNPYIKVLPPAATVADSSKSLHQQQVQALEEALTALQRSSAAETERANLKIATLESALSSERALTARLQAQLTAEAARITSAAESEAGAQQALAAARRALDAEKRSSREIEAKATKSIAELKDQISGLESRLHEEQAVSSRLQRKLTSATKAAHEAEAALAHSEAGRQEQSALLETASSQVTAMRSELRSLRARLAARDQQLQQQLQDMEHRQLAELHKQLISSQEQVADLKGRLSAFAPALLGLAQCLAPQPLASALHISIEQLTGFTANAAQHDMLIERLAKCIGGAVTNGDQDQLPEVSDVAALSARVRELLSAVQQACLSAERAEVARLNEADLVVADLQHQLNDTKAKLQSQSQAAAAMEASLRASVTAASARADELAAQVDSLTSQAALKDAAHAAAVTALQHRLNGELSQVTAQASEAEAQRAHWQDAALQAQQQLAEVVKDDKAIRQLAEAKEARVVQLRQALAKAIDTVAAAAQEHDAVLAAEKAAHHSTQSALAVSQAALQASQEACKKLQDQLASAESGSQQDIATVTGKLQMSESKIHQLEQELQALEQKQTRLMDSMVDITQQVAANVAGHKLLEVAQTSDYEPLQRGLRNVLALATKKCSIDTAADLFQSLAGLTTTSLSYCQESTELRKVLDQAGDLIFACHTTLAPATTLLNIQAPQHQAVADTRQAGHPGLLHSSQQLLTFCQVLADGLSQHASGYERQAKEKNDLELKVHELQQHLLESRQAAQQVASTHEQQAKSEVQHLTALLAAERAEKMKLEGQLSQSKSDVASLQTVLLSLRSQLAAAESASQSAQQSAADAQAQTHQLQASLAAALQKAAQLELAGRTTSKQGQKLAIRYRVACKKYATCQSKLAKARKNVRALSAKIFKGTATLKACSSELAREKEKSMAAAAAAEQHMAKLQRCEGLVHKLEERRASLESDKRQLTDKLMASQSRITSLEQAVESARRSESVARQETDKAAQAAAQKISASQQRAATLLQALEGAECALRDSQANANRLLQEVHKLREAEEQARKQLETLQVHCNDKPNTARPDLSPTATLHTKDADAATPTKTRSSNGSEVADTLPQTDQQRQRLSSSPAITPLSRAAVSNQGLLSPALPPVGSMNAALAAKEARITQLRDALSQLQSERNLLVEQVAALKSGPGSIAATTWAATLEKKANEAAAATRDAQLQLKQAKAEHARLQLEAAIASKKVLSLITHMSTTVDMGMFSIKEEQAPSSWPVLVDALQRLLTHMQHGQQALLLQIEHSKVACKDYDTRIAELQEHIVTCQKETMHVEGLRRQAIEKEAEVKLQIADLQQQLKQSHMRIEDLQTQLQQLLDQVASLQDQCQDLVRQKLAVLTATSKATPSNLAGGLQDDQEAESQLSAAGSTGPAGSALLQVTVAQLQREVDQLRQDLTDALQDAAATQSSHQECEARCSQLAQQLKVVEARLQDKEQECARDQRSAEDAARKAETTVQAAHGQVVAAELRAEEAGRAADMAASRCKAAEERLEMTEAALRRNQQQLVTCQAKVEEQDAQIALLKSQVADLNSTCSDYEQQLSETKQATHVQEQELQNHISSLQAQLTTANNAQQHLLDNAAHMAEQQARLEQELESAQVQILEHEQRVQQMKDVESELREQLRIANMRTGALQAEIDASDSHLQETMQATQASYAVEVAGLREALQHAEERVQSEQQSVSALSRRLQEVNATLETTELELQASRLEQCALQLECEAKLNTGSQLEQAATTAMNDTHMQHVRSLQQQLVVTKQELAQAIAKADALSAREASYVDAANQAHQDLKACEKQLEAMQLQNAQLVRDLAGALEQLATRMAHDEDDAASSISGMTATTATHTVRLETNCQDVQVANLLSDNRALLIKLQRMHAKLKLAKARCTELEGELAAHQGLQQEGKSNVNSLVIADSGVDAYKSAGTTDDQTKTQRQAYAYQVALQAAQQQMAVTIAQHSEAQQRIHTLEARLQEAQEELSRKDKAYKAVLQAAVQSTQSDSLLEYDLSAISDAMPTRTLSTLHVYKQSDNDMDVYGKPVIQLVQSQRHQISALQQALDQANASRYEDCASAAQLAEDLTAAQCQIRELQSTMASLQHQLDQQEEQRQLTLSNLRSQHSISQDSIEVVSGLARKMSDSSQEVDRHSLEVLETLQRDWATTRAAQAKKIASLEDALRVTSSDLSYTQQLLEEAQAKAESCQQQAGEERKKLASVADHARMEAAQAENKLCRAEGQLSVVSQQLDTSQQLVNTLQQDCRRLKSALDAATAGAKQEAGLKSALATANDTIDDLRNQQKQTLNHLAQLWQELSAFHHLTSTTDSNDKNISHAQQASNHTWHVHRLHTVIKEMLTQFSHSRDASQRLQQQLTDAVQQANRRAQEIATLQATVMVQSQKIAHLTSELNSCKQALVDAQTQLQHKDSELRAVESEISRQLTNYERLKARLLQQEQEQHHIASGQEAMAKKCDELHAALAAKQADYAAALAKCATQQEQLNSTRGTVNQLQERLRAAEARQELKSRSAAQQDQALTRAVTDMEAEKAAAAALKKQLDAKTEEVRELHQMLKAWEAMRLGKDAQIAALMERCKRHEEDAAEKARTVDALRRKLTAVGRASESHLSASKLRDSRNTSVNSPGSVNDSDMVVIKRDQGHSHT